MFERINNLKINGLLVISLMLLTTLALVSFQVSEVKATVNLKILTPHWDGIKTEYERAFDEYYFNLTEVHVNIEWINVSGTSNIVSYLDEAFEANNWTTANIDVLWGGGLDPFTDQKEKGHLQEYEVNSSTLEKIPEAISGYRIYDEDHTWYGSVLTSFGIIYNKDVLQTEGLPEPETWEDLADPALNGWVGSADPRTSGSNHMMYEIMLQAFGWEEGLCVATRLGANVESWSAWSKEVPIDVAAGEIAYGLAIDFYAWEQIDYEGTETIGYVMPDSQTIIVHDPIAILHGAPNESLAAEFLEFVLSGDGQKLLMLPTGASGGPVDYTLGRMSVMPDLYDLENTIVPVSPFNLTLLDFDYALSSQRWSLVNDLIGTMIVDAHSDLISLWSEINSVNNVLRETGLTSIYIDDALEAMCQVPLSEAAALSLDWDNPDIRNRYIIEWYEFAFEKYDEASDTIRELLSFLSLSFNIQIDSGSLYYPTEIVEFYLLTSLQGVPIDSTITKAMLYYRNKIIDLSGLVTPITTGVYRIRYQIPKRAKIGTATLIIESSYISNGIEFKGNSLKSIQIINQP